MEKRINEDMARLTWEMLLEEPCGGMVKEDVAMAMAMKKKVSLMICYGTMKEVVVNHIVNAIDFDEIKSTAMATISVGDGGECGRRINERDCLKLA
jgi:hypothetical protein